jgi:hypothetical protein
MRGYTPPVLFNVSIQPLPSGQPNLSIQIEAPDLVAALEAAKGPILKMALDSAAVLTAALPAAKPAEPVNPQVA